LQRVYHSLIRSEAGRRVNRGVRGYEAAFGKTRARPKRNEKGVNDELSRIRH